MRLIDVKTYKLEEFTGQWVPPYAILSHRWGDQEVSMRDLQAWNWLKRKDKRRGRDKIVGCCAAAAAEGIGFVWVDTCCIDKTSSAELSEAINSMFRWYQEATVCFAYLNDVKSTQYSSVSDSALAKSQWFTRGWTLQELLAPNEVVFFGSGWREIGTKTTLRSVIISITGISSEALMDREFSKYSVAQKMSWAADRMTTRPEDMAYCLLGLFDVNMPLLYGEGQGAFFRLQEEIMKRTDDESIFAWIRPPDHPLSYRSQSDLTPPLWSGLIATSPALFRHCSQISVLDKRRESLYGSGESSEDYLSAFELVRQHVRVRSLVFGPLKGILLTPLDIIPGLTSMSKVITSSEGLQQINHDADGRDYAEYPLKSKVECGDTGSPLILSSPKAWGETVEMLKEYKSPFEGPWLISEPVIVLPLMCSMEGKHLGLLLSRNSSLSEAENIFHRHSPSLICIEEAMKHTEGLSLLRTLFVSGKEYTESQVWSSKYYEIRIADLMDKGYVFTKEQGSLWVYEMQTKKLYTNIMGELGRHIVIFQHGSGNFTKYPSFFIEINFDEPIVGILRSPPSTSPPLYQALRVELNKQSRIEVRMTPSARTTGIVLKWRDMEKGKHLNLSIEQYRPGHWGPTFIMPLSFVSATFDIRLQLMIDTMRATKVDRDNHTTLHVQSNRNYWRSI